MSESSFRKEVEKLDYRESVSYVAQIIPSTSATGRSEMYNVSIFRTPQRSLQAGNYLLQWKKGRKPKLPGINPEVHMAACEKFNNLAYLSSGFGQSPSSSYTGGIPSVDNLVLVVEELRGLGIIIST